jgi:hypothetical protein
MKPVDVFAVVVRTIGLVVCFVSGAVLFFAILNLVLGGPVNAFGLAVVGAPLFSVGLWLLRGAPSLVAFAFPGAPRGTDQSESAGRVA